MLIDKLDTLTDKDQDKIDILKQSIFNGWNDVYELKESQKQPNKKKSKNNVTQLKTRFHNINQSFEKYTAEELERMLLENQKSKFNEN